VVAGKAREDMADILKPTPKTGFPEPDSHIPKSRASSTGQCNTVQSVDPTILHPGATICLAVFNQTYTE